MISNMIVRPTIVTKNFKNSLSTFKSSSSSIQSSRVLIPRVSFNQQRFSSTKRYTKEHEWVKYDSKSSIGTIGITDYAQKSLGDVVFVELPEVSTAISTGDQIGAVESVKAASDIFAPVAGTIVEVNEQLSDQAGLLNKSPEDEGWIAKIKLSFPQEVESLLSEEAYKAHCEGEDH